MQFNVARLLKGPVGTTQTTRLDETFEPLADTKTDRVWGQIRLVRINQGVWVSAALEATIESICCRCLQEFPSQVQFELDAICYSTVDVTTGVSVLLDDETTPEFTIDDHHTLNITEPVRQSVLLTLPMKPLCQNDCLGICPECGINLNETPCDCAAGTHDLRWASLVNTVTQNVSR